jgi:hypothetical protein
MRVFLVERSLPGASMAQLVCTQEAAIASCAEFVLAGRPVRYLQSVFVPSADRCLALFEAADAITVRAVNEAAHLSFTSIVEVVPLRP